MTSSNILARVAEDPRYVNLVRRRNRFTGVLTAIMLTAFFGYILLIAFNKSLLARPLGGGVTSLGIPLGIGVIILAIVLTGIYVRRANSEFDAELRKIREDAGA